MSQTAENPHGVERADEGERCVLRYQSKFHPDADKTEVEGVIDDAYPDEGFVYIEADDGRFFEVTPTSVVVHTDADDNYVDRSVGTDPEVEVKRLYRVYVDGTVAKFVRADDEDTAREHAISIADHGEMNDATDADAATRTDEDEMESYYDKEVHDT